MTTISHGHGVEHAYLTGAHTVAEGHGVPHSYVHQHDWLPSSRIFSPTKEGEDPRLFDGDHLRPEVRTFVLEQICEDWDDEFPDWLNWATVYLAGGEASRWWGSHAAHGGGEEADDFDVLVAVDFDALKADHPEFDEQTPEEIAPQLTQYFRNGFNVRNERAEIPGVEGIYGMTAYVNPSNSRDLSVLQPYAAYDISDDRWGVEPYSTPEDWSARSLPESYWDALEGLIGYIDGIKAMPEPYRSREGAALFDRLHNDRTQAFGPNGTGVFDFANVQWKYLDLHPEHPLDFLLQCKREASGKTASAEEAIRHEVGKQQVHPISYPSGKREMLCPAHYHLRQEHDAESRAFSYDSGLLDEGEKSSDQSLEHGLPPAQQGRCADCTRAQNDPYELPWKQRPQTTDRVPDRMSPYTPSKTPERPARHVAPFQPLRQSLNRVVQHDPGTSPEPTGIMVAVVPPESLVGDLVVEGGEDPEQLHVTLSYIGHTEDYDSQLVEDLPEVVRAWADGHEPFEAKVQGAGTFVNEGNHVLLALVDAPALTRMHVSLTDHLKEHGYRPSEEHSFTPHLTLSYEKHHVRFLPKITPTAWTVEDLWVCIGGRWESIPLGVVE